MTTVGWLHVLGVWFAVVFGLAVLIGRKGNGLHRWMGRAYVASMLLVNVAALAMNTTSPGVFHALAGVSLATLALGVLAIQRRSKSTRAVASHGHFMAWSFVGLLAAGAGQGAAALDGSVFTTIIVTLLVGGLWIQFGGIGRIARRIVSAQK